METFSERMESIIQGIHFSQEARKSDLEAISKDVEATLKDARSMLQEFQFQHQGMAADLKTFLNLSMKSLSQDVRKLHNDFQKFLKDFRREYKTSAEELRERLGISVSELKSNVHNLMERFNMMHENMAEELRENLGSNRKDRADFVRETIERFRGQMDELGADIRKARELWLRRRTTTPTGPKLEVKKRVYEEEVAREERIPEELSPRGGMALEKRILKIIQENPDGIRLVDIGNQIGMNWRSLVKVVKLIEDKQAIERLTNFCYPIKG